MRRFRQLQVRDGARLRCRALLLQRDMHGVFSRFELLRYRLLRGRQHLQNFGLPQLRRRWSLMPGLRSDQIERMRRFRQLYVRFCCSLRSRLRVLLGKLCSQVQLGQLPQWLLQLRQLVPQSRQFGCLRTSRRYLRDLHERG